MDERFEKNPLDDRLLIKEGENAAQTETNNLRGINVANTVLKR
jgi:hypothetical protein